MLKASGLLLTVSTQLPAQHIDWRTRAVFYADNTEFFTSYRVGETILGGRVGSWFDIAPGQKTLLRLGASIDRRWGSKVFVDSIKPLISFRYQTTHSQAILGTLESEDQHNLLPALMVNTRDLTRPVEYGGQWRETRKNFRGDVWINWQQLNTPEEREGFEVGAVLAETPMPGLTVEGQHLWSHRGGQLYSAGVSVSNNRVTAFGVSYEKLLPHLHESSISVHQLWSDGHLEPPPGDTRPNKGHGTLVRADITPWGWFNLYGLSWWGKDFSAAAGDANYGSTGHVPTFYKSSRRYTEFGATRTTEIENGVTFSAELRFDKVDNEKSVAFFDTSWEFAYRLLVKVPIDLVVKKGP